MSQSLQSSQATQSDRFEPCRDLSLSYRPKRRCQSGFFISPPAESIISNASPPNPTGVSPTAPPESAATHTRWHVSAAVAAWLLPGLGHAMLGQWQRGLLIGVTIMLMWLGGLALGGVSVVDTQRGRAWFMGQMLVAPSVAVLMYHNQLRKRYIATQGPQPPVEGASPPAYEPAYGRMAEVGTLYTALAGMMNLLAMIDVVYRDPKARRRSEQPSTEEPT